LKSLSKEMKKEQVSKEPMIAEYVVYQNETKTIKRFSLCLCAFVVKRVSSGKSGVRMVTGNSENRVTGCHGFRTGHTKNNGCRTVHAPRKTKIKTLICL